MTLKSDEKAPHLHPPCIRPWWLLSRLSNICKHNPVVRMITIIHGERRKSVWERERERERERVSKICTDTSKRGRQTHLFNVLFNMYYFQSNVLDCRHCTYLNNLALSCSKANYEMNKETWDAFLTVCFFRPSCSTCRGGCGRTGRRARYTRSWWTSTLVSSRYESLKSGKLFQLTYTGAYL